MAVSYSAALRLPRGLVGQFRSNFFETFHSVNGICASQQFRGICEESFYKDLISAALGETKCFLCPVTKV